jgi:ribosomal protein L40E
MDLSQNINSSMDYVRGLFTDLGRLVILVILNIIPIVNLIVVGYMAKTVRETPASESPPRLEGYGGLWVDGLKVALASIIYLFIPIILVILGGLSIFMPMTPRHVIGLTPISLGLGFGLMIVGVILAFIIAIIMAMAIVHMVKTGSFAKAFEIGEILRIINAIGWGKYILWLIVIFILAVIVGAAGSIPAIGWLISLIISPIFGVFAARSAALLYVDAKGPREVPERKFERRFCIACGSEIPPEAVYCTVCGKPQQT